MSLETESHLQEMYDCAYEDAFFRAWDDPARVPHAHDTSAYLKLNFRLRLVRERRSHLSVPRFGVTNIFLFFFRFHCT